MTTAADTTSPVSFVPDGRKAIRDGRPGRKLTFDYVSFMVVFLGLPLAIFLVFVIWPFANAIRYSFTDWTGFKAEFNYIGFDNFTKLFHDDLFRHALRNNLLFALVIPIVTIVDRPDVRHADDDRRLEPRPAARRAQLELLSRRVVLPVRDPRHRDRVDLEPDLRARRAGCSTACW